MYVITTKDPGVGEVLSDDVEIQSGFRVGFVAVNAGRLDERVDILMQRLRGGTAGQQARVRDQQ